MVTDDLHKSDNLAEKNTAGVPLAEWADNGEFMIEQVGYSVDFKRGDYYYEDYGELEGFVDELIDDIMESIDDLELGENLTGCDKGGFYFTQREWRDKFIDILTAFYAIKAIAIHYWDMIKNGNQIIEVSQNTGDKWRQTGSVIDSYVYSYTGCETAELFVEVFISYAIDSVNKIERFLEPRKS